MPTYQYRCRACGDELEAVQKFTDPALTECPSCAGELRKIFSAVGVVFKGSGFYATDSRKPETSASEPAKTKTASTSTPAASSETSKSTTPTPASASA